MITEPRTLKPALVLLLACILSSAVAQKQDLRRHYGLIFGTAFGPDDRPLYGVKVQIYEAGKKHPKWSLISDHRGEFAQRVPPGPADYIVVGHADVAALENGMPTPNRKKRLNAETRVHIQQEERQDISLHLVEKP